MPRRKTIALLDLMPDTAHGQRICEGVFTQCNKYGYNVAVFSSMTPLQFYFQGYSDGEMKIYDLPDYSIFDGIIIDSLSLTDNNVREIPDHISAKIKAECRCPVVCLGIPFGTNYDVVNSSNDFQLREMCRHVVNVHGKKDILLLTGFKDNPEAENRLAVLSDELEKLGVPVPEDNKIYGDFWYTCGDALADEFLSGKRPMPEAVIAASDHMALGLIEKLHKNGVKIPEELIVIGFEATQEALLGEVTLSSYESNFTKTAADAVDKLRRTIEPDAPIDPYVPDINSMFHAGQSCGCEPDLKRSAKAFRDALYYRSKNYTAEDAMDNIDIGLLMENYVSEIFTSSKTPEECLDNIYHNSYLLFPFLNFALCLREDWLTAESDELKSYPDKMKIVLANTQHHGLSFYKPEDALVIDTKTLFPIMQEYTDTPSVFYFASVHFSDHVLGYAVMQRELTDSHKLNLVFRNWLRLVNNSLEMVRTRNRYVMLSIHDNMTGLYNRRGMYELFGRLTTTVDPEDRLFVSVIDMDGLKYVNDTFGHDEGDFGIMSVSRAAKQVARPEELCIRAGGDEFYIVGIGDYTDDECEKRRDDYLAALSDISHNSGKCYPISASIGCALGKSGERDLEELLRIADEEMYRFKVQRKKHRE